MPRALARWGELGEPMRLRPVLVTTPAPVEALTEAAEADAGAALEPGAVVPCACECDAGAGGFLCGEMRSMSLSSTSFRECTERN
jgi:hypothetical protein